MQFAGTTEINAPRSKVWAFVIDPQQVGWCGPGVESIDQVDATHFKARAKVGIGPISARFAVNLELAEAVEPDRAVIKASGNAPGSAVDATGEMVLSGPADGPTTHGLVRRRAGHGCGGEHRLADDRGNRQQAHRPGLRLHARKARGGMSPGVRR